MGYYTRYSLEGYNGNQSLTIEEQRKVMEKLSEISGYFTPYSDDEPYDYDFSEVEDDSIKWYEHRSDMEKLSVFFHDYVFVLCGSGEDNCDIWVEYFKNGVSEHCDVEITMPAPRLPEFEMYETDFTGDF